MKKLVSLALAAAMTLGLAACGGQPAAPAPSDSSAAGSAAPMTLTVAYADAEDSVFGKGVAAFSEKLEELSGGTMTCKIYPNGTLGTISEVSQMLQNGTCDVSPIVTSSLTSSCPDLGVFDLPFLFKDYAEARAALDGEAGTTLAEKLSASKLHVASWLTMGFREVTSKNAVNTVDEFKNMKIRTQSNEVHMDIFKTLGASPTVVNFSELYTALELGTVDGQENPYVNILSNAYYDVNSYLVETNHVFQVAALLVGQQTYDKLSDEQRTWVDDAAAYAADVEWTATEADNEQARKSLVEEHGMTLIEMDHAALADATASVYDDYKDQYGALVDIIRG